MNARCSAYGRAVAGEVANLSGTDACETRDAESSDS